MDAEARARRWAEEILSGPWARERYRLALLREEVRALRQVGHEVLRMRFVVWERLGAAAVRLDRRGEVRAAVFPAPADAARPGRRDGVADLSDPALAPAVAAARAAAAENAPAAAGGRVALERVRVREGWLAARRGGAVLTATLEHEPADGALTIDLDARDGTRLGFSCLPFRRGSRRSAALSRFSAVKRARAALVLPDGARLVRCELTEAGGARLWRLRWETPGPDATARGFVAAAFNARTGQLCESLVALRPAPAAAFPPRAEARRTIELTARVRLGPGAEVGPLVLGRRGAPGQRRPVWLAVVRDPAGGVVRATLAGGRVAFLMTTGRAQRSA